MQVVSTEVRLWDDAAGVAKPAPSAAPRTTDNGQRTSARYETDASWSQRHFEVFETTRLNQDHWEWATADYDLNYWLRAELARVRSRAIYETRNNATLQGICRTLAEDVVGSDGPTLQVLSDDHEYNEALEAEWRTWFAAPTFRPNVSGAQLLKLWVRNLPRCGEFLAWIDTDPRAEGNVAMRLRPLHPRRLQTPYDQQGNQLCILGVEMDQDERIARYHVACTIGKAYVAGFPVFFTPVPPDLMIHEFLLDEEGQARGWPWFAPCLQPAADLRDYDDQVQDAARQMADSASMLYTTHPEAVVWKNQEETRIERRTVKMCPPGWQPWQYNSSQPPVQYPDFRAERQRELGRPIGMPLLVVRCDASKHSYSGARIDTQSWRGTVRGIQLWISGTPTSAGTLNRLVDLVAAEARFSNPALRKRPERVEYVWTWPVLPHVDPLKEVKAETESLESRTLSLDQALANRGSSLETHVHRLQRVERAFRDAGLAPPSWLLAKPTAPPPDPASAAVAAETGDGAGDDADGDADEDVEEPVGEEETADV